MCLPHLIRRVALGLVRLLERPASGARVWVGAWVGATLFVGPAAVADGGPVTLVENGATTVELAKADLVAAVAGANGSILALTPTGRGTLFDLGASLQYQPGAAFFEHGSDSFHYEAGLVGGGSAWRTAFLVAGMAGDGAFFMPLDEPVTEMQAVTLTRPERLSVNDENPIHGTYDLLIDLEPGPESYLTFARESGEGGTGGVIFISISGGGSSPDQVGAELMIAAAQDASGQDLARVFLIEGENGLEVAGEVRSSASVAFARTASLPTAHGQRWQLQWWSATADGSLDGGGLLLAATGQLALLPGLDNPWLPAPVSWTFGDRGNSGFGGEIQIDDLAGESATRPPRISPVFGDNFEASAPVWTGGSCGASPAPSAQSGSLVVLVDPAVSHCFKSISFAKPQRQHRVRFSVDFTSLVIGAGEKLSLLHGHRAGDVKAHLEVRARRSTGGVLEVRADADLDDGSQVNLPWVAVPETGEVLLEVHWWASSVRGAGNGGLRLSVGGELAGETLDLSNAGLAVDQLRLGAMSVAAGSSGQIAFGGVEAWR